MKCVIYVRVSDEKQVAGASLGDQERACRAFAEREGLSVARVYRDEGRSAYKDELRYRPEFERLLAAGKGRLFGAVVVYKLDRFARKARVYHNARWQLEQAGVALLSATEPNEATAAGRLSSAMLADFAEFYSAQLSERIRDAAQSKARRGLWVGPPPFGYDLRERQLVPNQWRLWVVIIFVAYSEGANTTTIAHALNAAGIPTRSGKPWTKDTVSMVLRNRAYIGQAGGRALKTYQAAHEALVTPELWSQVAARLSERRKRPQGPRKPSTLPPLSYVPLCALCGSKMHRHRQPHSLYFRCYKALNHTCAARGVKIEQVDHQVQLLRQTGTPVAVVWLRAPRGIERFE